MPQSPAYTLLGAPFFDNTLVNFQISFQNEGDQSLVQSYEWYLDGTLVTNAIAQTFAAQVGCGNHVISARVLYQDVWTGKQELNFATCRTIIAIDISGPDSVPIGDNAVYKIIRQFSDGSSEDITNLYSFSSSVGGSFNSNIFTATGAPSLTPPFGVTITATSAGETPLTKDINVIEEDVNSMGILVIDLYNNSTLNVIGLIDNVEVIESHVAAYTGNNIVPAESAAADALILASDFIDGDVLNWRFEFNLHKLKHQYPDTDQFKLFIKGRGTAVTTLNAAYAVFNPEGTMTMANSPGTYLPSVSGGIQVIGQTLLTANLVAGANGSYNEGDLAMIIKFTYTVSNNTVTYALI